MRNLKLIIQREYKARVRNKTFIVMTFLSPLILVGMIFLVAYLSMLNNSQQHTIGINDLSGVFEDEFHDTEEIKFINLSAVSLEDARDLVLEKEYYGMLHIPKLEDNLELARSVQFFAKESPAIGVLQQIEHILSEKLNSRELIARGVDISKIESAETPVNIQIQNFEGIRTSKMSNYVKMFFGGAAGYLLMMFIIIYGNMVMRSVIEEKTNRIIEIIVSSVKPIHLMLGKILGTSLAGITQFAIWIVLATILMVLAVTFSGMDLNSVPPEAQQGLEQMSTNELQQLFVDITNLPMATLIIAFLVYFIGGYFLYSAIYAAIGAAVDSETDTQQFMFPIIFPLMLGIYVGFFSVIENPHGTISTIFLLIFFYFHLFLLIVLLIVFYFHLFLLIFLLIFVYFHLIY